MKFHGVALDLGWQGVKVDGKASADLISAFIEEDQALVLPDRPEELALDLTQQPADFEHVFKARSEAHRHRKLYSLITEILDVELFVHDALFGVDDTVPLQSDRLSLYGPAVRRLKIRRRQLKDRTASLPRTGGQWLRMFAAEEQLVAVEIAAIMVVQAEAMPPGHRHFPFRRSEKEQVPMLDDDRFRYAMGHRRHASLRQNLF